MLATTKQEAHGFSRGRSHEDPNFRGEPAGVEASDWYTNQPQNVVGTIRRRSVENR